MGAAAREVEPSLAHTKPRGRTMPTPMVRSLTPVRNFYLDTRNDTHELRRRHHIHKNIRGTGTRLITMRTTTRFLPIPELMIMTILHNDLPDYDAHPMPPSHSQHQPNHERVRQSRHPRRQMMTRGERAFRLATHSKIGIQPKNQSFCSEVFLMPTHSASGSTIGLSPGMVRELPCRKSQVTSGYFSSN